MRFKEFYLSEKYSKTFEYSSTQYDLPADLSMKIHDWGMKTISNSILDLEDGRQSENDIHLTVLYGLHTTESERVETLIELFSPFEVELGEISLFKQESKDVVKIEILPNHKLTSLHKFLKNNLKNSYKFDEYRPHITVAYVRPNTCDDLIGDLTFSGIKLLVNCIQFSSNKGFKTPIYLE